MREHELDLAGIPLQRSLDGTSDVHSTLRRQHGPRCGVAEGRLGRQRGGISFGGSACWLSNGYQLVNDTATCGLPLRSAIVLS